MINRYFYFVVIIFGDFVNGLNFTLTTNYTLSYFQSYNISQATECTTDIDCPLYSKCNNFTQDENILKVCRFENFLCSNDDQPCLYINETMWDIQKEKVMQDYLSYTPSPIIKICPRNKVKTSIYKTKQNNNNNKQDECYTTYCKHDTDCYSEMCYYNRCIYNYKNDKIIYMCSGDQFPDEFIRCGIASGVPAEEESECFFKIKKGSYCITPIEEKNTGLVIIITVGIFAGMSLILFLVILCHECIKNCIESIEDTIDSIKESKEKKDKEACYE
ncbi:hypothetical protein BCR32DRAFT_267233 [Anaeromyces robustus]|uniref:Uncharacterized protein n=1 Tax=Anaeromyces robustus TaxID=1754192 RepID=A0A1Y1XBF1_9FUNG|nr:hypothetical protein BCR32DRAFT_267233 [Anaeromyces robustus]|eukprot:ORX83068.1 hypothetical protein BCR32DRAFT_267233 [Anaeromyces robustus]